MVAKPDDAEYTLQRWRTGQATELDLYAVVSDPMDQAARRGLRGILRDEPDPHDVQTAVVDAFRELWNMDPSNVTRLIGLAATIADKRARDRGRAIIREDRKMHALIDDLGHELELPADDGAGAAQRAELATSMRGCIDALPDAQRSVLEYTYMQGGKLIDWAQQRGKTHQAAVQQRQRAEAAVRRCVERQQSRSNGRAGSTEVGDVAAREVR